MYIFDLDGTLADISHRLHYLNGENSDWDAFFAACPEDKPINHVISIAHALLRECMCVEIWTGRSEAVREQTERWLGDQRIVYSKLRMRADGDHRHDDIIKKEWLEERRKEGLADPVAVFEDRDSVVKMWRDSGVPCYQVAPGNF